MEERPNPDAWSVATGESAIPGDARQDAPAVRPETLPVPWRPGQLDRRPTTDPVTTAVLLVLAVVDVVMDTLGQAVRTTQVSAASDAALGLTWTTYRVAAATLSRASRPVLPVVRWAYEAPALPVALRPKTWTLAAEVTWRTQRDSGRAELTRVTNDVLPNVVGGVIAQLDLTRIVLDDVDLARVVAAVLDEIDLTAVARERIDLANIAEEVIDEIDLPEIIRQSTGSVATETVRSVRLQGVDADERVQRIVDRVLAWRTTRRTGTSAASDASGSAPDE